jgi:hypothetical protein
LFTPSLSPSGTSINNTGAVFETRVIAGTYLGVTGYSGANSLPSIIPTLSLITNDALANRRTYIGDAQQWRDLSAFGNPVMEKPVYTIDVNRGGSAPEWQYIPRNSAGTQIAISEPCVGGTLGNKNATDFSGRRRTIRTHSTSAVLNAVCGQTTAVISSYSQMNPRWATTFQSPSVLTTVRATCGLAIDSVFSAPTDNPTATGAWFRFSSTAGDTNIMFCTSDGASAATCTSTGVAVVADTPYVVQIDARETGAIVGWVNGIARVRVTTNLPGSTDVVMGCNVQTLAAAAIRGIGNSTMTLEGDL